MSMLQKLAHVFLLELGYRKVKGGHGSLVRCTPLDLIEQIRPLKNNTVFNLIVKIEFH